MTTPAIQDKVLVSKDTLNSYRTAQVQLKQTLTAGQVWDYDIAAQLGVATAALYDLAKTQVEVFVVDTDTGSPTNGYYVPAVAVAGVGFKEDGKVRVVNQYSADLSFMIRVIIFRKPL